MDADPGTEDTGRSTDDFGTSRSDGQAHSSAAQSEPPDPRRLAQDWITLWQTEISAMATDPEIRESWQALMEIWAGTMASLIRSLPRQPHDAGRNERAATGQARPADAPGSAPAAAAPDTRDAEIERLARHVAALESRLAELERGSNPAGNPKRRPGRKPSE